jgi:hypothetical protein
MKKLFSTTVIFLLYGIVVTAQINCDFKVDKEGILNNLNLDAFVHKMQANTFTFSHDKNKIPAFVREQFKCLIRDPSTPIDTLLANPGEKWNSTDVIMDNENGKPLPFRQLAFYAESKEIKIIGYSIGGIGTIRTVIFMRFLGHKLVDVWSFHPRCDLRQFKTIKSILKYIDENRTKKAGLNFGYISY